MNYLFDSVIYFFFIFIKINFEKHYQYVFVPILILLSILLKINVFELNINTLIFILLSFSALAYLKKGNDYELFYIMLLYLIIGNLSSQIIIYVLYCIQNTDKTIIAFILNNSIPIYIISRIIIFVILFFISKFGLKNIFNVKYKFIEVLPILLVSSTLLFTCIILSKMLYGQWILTSDILALDIILFFIVILINILFNYFSEYKYKIYERDNEKNILESRLVSQKEIFDLHDELIHFKHDLKHTFRYIEDLLKIGDIDSALNIIEKQHSLSVLNKNHITSKCPIFDLIINDYKNKATNEKIDMKLLASITSDINIDLTTFNSLLCNCLDNAFENTGINGLIEITANINPNIIEITIINSISSIPIMAKDSKYHGKGLNNVRNYIRQTNGTFELIIDENAEITLKIPNCITPD